MHCYSSLIALPAGVLLLLSMAITSLTVRQGFLCAPGHSEHLGCNKFGQVFIFFSRARSYGETQGFQSYKGDGRARVDTAKTCQRLKGNGGSSK